MGSFIRGLSDWNRNLFHGTAPCKTAEKIYALWGGTQKRAQKKNTNYANSRESNV